MIPAGRRPIDAERAARLHGMALKTARNRQLFTRPGFPAPLTSPNARPLLWDEEQVQAHAAHQPVPPIPAAPPHPEDLLDRVEAASEWSITPETWDSYSREGRPRYAPPPDRVISGRELWFRRTLSEFPRPGRGAGAGRPAGARDQRPRDHKSKRARLAEVAEVMHELGPDAPNAQIVQRLVQVTGLSRPSASRLLRDARNQHTEDANPTGEGTVT